MPTRRRDRRSGVRFIEDDRDRSLTFFKRRSGLFKAASDLSTLTGARVALVLESEHGKFSSFGTPEAGPILDAFLLGSAPTDLDTSEEDKAAITSLQNEVFQLEKDKAMEDRRKKESLARTNEKRIQKPTKVARYAYSSIEDLEDAAELVDMCRELSRVKQEINARLPATTLLLHENKQVEEAGGGRRLGDPSLLQPTCWWRSSMAPQAAAAPPPKYPWAAHPFQACFHKHPWPSTTTASLLARSPGLSLPNPVILPSPPLVPENSLHHYYPLAPHTPAPNLCSHHIREIDLHISNGNSSHPLSLLSPILSTSSTPQPSSLQTTPPSSDSSPLSLSPPISTPLHLGPPSQQFSFNLQSYNNSVQPPHQNYANAGSTSIHSHQLSYSNLLSSPGLNAELGNTYKSGGTQVGSGQNERFRLSTSTSPELSDDSFDRAIPKSFSDGESSGGGGDAGSFLGGLNFPGY